MRTTTVSHVSLPRVRSNISASFVKTPTPDFNVQKQKTHPLNLVVNPQNPIIISKNPNLPSPVNPCRLHYYLDGYDPHLKQYLIDGFSQGFKLGCVTSPEKRLCKNHSSIQKNFDLVQEKLKVELHLGRIEGPFKDLLFPDLVCTPLGLISKSTPGKFRFIHDLLFPASDSVNSHIPDEEAKVQYDTIYSVIELVKKFGQGCLMAKTDLEDAFRVIPIHPSCFKLLGFSWNDEFYFDRCLPMGARSSCRIFETFSCALQWIMCNKSHTQGMSHMIDDFFFFGKQGSQSCVQDLSQFISLCSDIGVPIKHEKTVLPSTVITIYGIEIDSVAMECRLPKEKVEKIREKLQYFVKKKKGDLNRTEIIIRVIEFCHICYLPWKSFFETLN